MNEDKDMEVNEDLELLAKLSVEENKSQVRWFRHLTLVLSTLLGVLVSLGRTAHDSPLRHWSYGLATLLLSLALCGCFVLLYTYSAWSATQAKEAYRSELNNAIKEGRPIRPTGVVLPNWRKAVQVACYACVATAFLLLGVYSLAT